MKQNKVIKIIEVIISLFTSLFLSAFCFYLFYKHNYWFIALGIHFIFDALFVFIPSLIKDDYKAMRVQGIYQILSSIVVMSYLLVMMLLWNDVDQVMLYQTSYIVFGTAIGVKLITSIMTYISIKINYHPLLHAYRNNDINTLIYLGVIIALTIFNYYHPGTGTEGLLKEKPLWVYNVLISINVVTTLIVALFALSTDIRSKTKEQLSTFGKIKYVMKWFDDNEVTMFFGFIFTAYLIFLSLINVKQSIFYIFIAAYYLVLSGIRFINYYLHKKIEKASKGDEIKDNRRSSWILLLNAFAYTIFSDILCVGAVILMLQKANVGTNIYMLLFAIIPFAILKFIFAMRQIKKQKLENHTYRLGVGYISLINAFFSLLEMIAIIAHSFNIFWRYSTIIIAVIVIKVVVLLFAIAFVVHFFRSLIVNRRRRKKKNQEIEEAK